MDLSQKKFNQLLLKNYIFEKSPYIAVAVSGGPDSMCLAYLLNDWIKVCGGKLIAIIIDHGLRSESNEEAMYVKDQLVSLKIESHVLKIKSSYVLKKSMNEARNNRFFKLVNFCKKKYILHLFLGHHLDDDLETFLLRKIAGSNFAGLNSIQSKSYNKSLQILRPLLKFTKNDILKFIKIKKIKYVEDPSNYNTKYSRSIVRKFLSLNQDDGKEAMKDFINIKKIYPYYQQMIFQIFNQSVISIHEKQVILNAKLYLKQDLEVQAKIIEIIYKYLNPIKGFIRYKKTMLLIDILSKNNTVNRDFAGILIKKYDFLIKFSH